MTDLRPNLFRMTACTAIAAIALLVVPAGLVRASEPEQKIVAVVNDEAISEGDDIYVIDAEKCDDCATCVDSCPSEAIVPAD